MNNGVKWWFSTLKIVNEIWEFTVVEPTPLPNFPTNEPNQRNEYEYEYEYDLWTNDTQKSN